MPPTADPYSKERRRLLTACEALTTRERRLVQFISIAYEATARTLLMQGAHRAGLRAPRGVRYTSRPWKSLLQKLLNKGLLEEENNRLYCNPLIAEILARQAVHEGTFAEMAAAVQDPLGNPGRQDGSPYADYDRFVRDLRLALYGRDYETLERVIASGRVTFSLGADELPWEFICNNPFDREWVTDLPPQLLENVLYTIIHSAHLQLSPAGEAVDLAADLCHQPPFGRLRAAYVQDLILTGHLDQARAFAPTQRGADPLALRPWLAVLTGDDETALPQYEAGLKDLRKDGRRRKIYYNSLGGIYGLVSLLRCGGPQNLERAADYLAQALRQDDHAFWNTCSTLDLVVKQQQTPFARQDFAPPGGDLDESANQIDLLFRALTHYWLAPRTAKRWAAPLTSLRRRAQRSGYRLFAAEAAELHFRLTGAERSRDYAADLRREIDFISIVDAVVYQEPWQRTLHALDRLSEAPQLPAQTEPASRLVWLLDYRDSAQGPLIELEPRHQKRKKDGTWSQGRTVALERLFERKRDFDFLSEQDERVCKALQADQAQSSYGFYYGQVTFDFDLDRALLALIGHPLVFLQDNPSVRLEVQGGEPALQVFRDGANFLVTLNPPFDPDDESRIALVRESPTRLQVVEINPQHRRIAQLLGPEGLRLPQEAHDEVLQTLTQLAPLVTVHADISDAFATEVETDSRPHLHLTPFDEGLQAELVVQPLGPSGPLFPPGEGDETVFAQIEDRPLQARRALAEERRRAAAALRACPALQRDTETQGLWLFPDPEDALQLLLDLRSLNEEFVVEWPQGQEWRVSQRASWGDLSLRLGQQEDWFGLTGQLQLDEGLVLDMRRLLELLAAGPGHFLPLGDRQFLALTEEFRRRLEELQAFSETQGRGVRVHPLATTIVEELVDGAGQVDIDAAWRQQLARLQRAQAFEPRLPADLHAQLRDYQVEGFRWASRLAHWGVGACLADDMGLGKTVQALALILERAPEGPTLVVAPTSVGANWIEEARRFAPALRPTLFGPGDRRGLLTAAGAFDLIVCSYGLLQQERALFGGIVWRTIVLDEAQAIKNSATRRSQAAMALQGEFKMITTGTPIENHLGELWNLFRFINPGLLGSLERFNQRFAGPIEKEQSQPARQRLKRLIQPFILRRTKGQVLKELPPRTEITLQVELGAQEMAFYEALRRQAVERLEAAPAQAGPKHMQILAQIMRLRRACCHPRLVLSDSSLPSAKMEVFGETLDELIENGHKALVFSQFVGYLNIARQYLDGRGIAYQYLDGGTPARQRQKRVAAFQRGEGDLFLISLRAGGQGLNLTAADYVIHLDPWWNPAVEDQASDRVHRIGQERPVTVYRLVARHTIEEKIVGLHQRKRDLADGLLEGSDLSGKISAAELMRLIRED